MVKPNKILGWHKLIDLTKRPITFDKFIELYSNLSRMFHIPNFTRGRLAISCWCSKVLQIRLGVCYFLVYLGFFYYIMIKIVVYIGFLDLLRRYKSLEK